MPAAAPVQDEEQAKKVAFWNMLVGKLGSIEDEQKRHEKVCKLREFLQQKQEHLSRVYGVTIEDVMSGLRMLEAGTFEHACQ